MGKITANAENNTISVELTVNLGGGHNGKLTADIKIEDMSPEDISQIHDLTDTVAKQIVNCIAYHAITLS